MSTKATSPTMGQLVCPECGDSLPSSFNFCPRCVLPIRFDPDQDEGIYEISDPPSVECYILRNNDLVIQVLAQPDLNSRYLFRMTGNDLLRIDGEEGSFLRVTTPGGRRGFVAKELGIRVRRAIGPVQESQAMGYYRVNEHLIGWKLPRTPFQIENVPIHVEPSFQAEGIGRIKSDIALPVVGETFGWFMVQLPSLFRGWVPEAYGYRMLRPDSFPEISRPRTAAETLAGIAGVVGVITLAGAAAALDALDD